MELPAERSSKIGRLCVHSDSEGYSIPRKSLNKCLTSGRILRLRPPTHWMQFTLHLSTDVCLRLCACICICLCVFASACVHLRLLMRVCIYVCVCACISVCMHPRAFSCVCASVWMFLHGCVCIHLCSSAYSILNIWTCSDANESLRLDASFVQRLFRMCYN